MSILLSYLFPKTENVPAFYRKPDFKKVEPDMKLNFSQWAKMIHRKSRKIEIDAELLVNRRTNDGERIPSFTDTTKWSH